MQRMLFFNHWINFKLINMRNTFFYYLIITNILEQFRKTCRLPFILNALFNLFSLQPCLLFFLKMMKLYKDICSAWIGRDSAEFFFLTDQCHKQFKNTDNTSMDFQKVRTRKIIPYRTMLITGLSLVRKINM